MKSVKRLIDYFSKGELLVLIVLWVSASIADARYISVVVCIAAFLINDIYGFLNWRKMKERQMADNAKVYGTIGIKRAGQLLLIHTNGYKKTECS